MNKFRNRYIYSNLHPCDACGNKNFEFVATMLSSRLIGLKAKIVICKDCGLINTNPRPTRKVHSEINNIWYNQKYLQKPPEKIFKNRVRNWELMWKRIGSRYPDGPKRVLDIGAGHGAALEFLKSRFPKIKATAIEQSPICRSYIEDKLGFNVLDIDINSTWPIHNYKTYDLIIFRHTLEHLLEPLRALEQIYRYQSTDGFTYLVVPNAMHLPSRRGMRTGYFIPVHINYFNIHTLVRICERVGLTPELLKAENEIWGLFRSNNINSHHKKREPENSYNVQKQEIMHRIRAGFFYDAKEVAKIIIKSMPFFYFRRYPDNQN